MFVIAYRLILHLAPELHCPSNPSMWPWVAMGTDTHPHVCLLCNSCLCYSEQLSLSHLTYLYFGNPVLLKATFCSPLMCHRRKLFFFVPETHTESELHFKTMAMPLGEWVLMGWILITILLQNMGQGHGEWRDFGIGLLGNELVFVSCRFVDALCERALIPCFLDWLTHRSNYATTWTN